MKSTLSSIIRQDEHLIDDLSIRHTVLKETNCREIYSFSSTLSDLTHFIRFVFQISNQKQLKTVKHKTFVTVTNRCSVRRTVCWIYFENITYFFRSFLAFLIAYFFRLFFLSFYLSSLFYFFYFPVFFFYIAIYVLKFMSHLLLVTFRTNIRQRHINFQNCVALKLAETIIVSEYPSLWPTFLPHNPLPVSHRVICTHLLSQRNRLYGANTCTPNRELTFLVWYSIQGIHYWSRMYYIR